jgi:hypothetical protein
MPEFPGLAKAESTSDWDAGFPLDHKIRPKDEDYWKRYRGTPKAFVTLAAGRKLWGNRFGDLTAIRFPVPPGMSQATFVGQLERAVLADANPAELGLAFEPVRTQALAASSQGTGVQFGGLFIGFSFFLIVAALLLMALLFQFGLEQRATEVGTLLALGFQPGQVRRVLLGEGAALAFVGGGLGLVGGILFSRAMLHGLTTIWRDAVSTSALSFHVTPLTLGIGLVASTMVGTLTIALALRRQGSRPARELLAQGAEHDLASPSASLRGRSRSGILAALSLLGAIALVGWTLWNQDTAAAGAFFGAGSLLLVAGLAGSAAWFASLAGGGTRRSLSLSGLGFRGCVRRRSRSLSTIGLLACGTFLIASIGVFRLDANRDATKRSSGTGGFALIGESTLPVVHDLNTPAGRDFHGLGEAAMAGVSVVPLRVRDGDDASCLNLNRAQKPRLLGVKPEHLAGRFTFAKAAGGLDVNAGWKLLASAGAPDEVPAIGDLNSILWALGRKVGDTLDYVDERGRPFKVRLVGAVANSILQGSLLIDEAEFVRRFPGESGHRMFLIDAPSNAVSAVSAALSQAMQDAGLELTEAPRRLAAFNAVQNTYLGTFQVLGGLGLLLGSAGLGVVVLRNVLERRGELALLRAVGFRPRALEWLVLTEHSSLLALGLAIGVLAAAVAVLPSALSPGSEIPYRSLAATLAGVLLNGALWTWLATRWALRGDLLETLRNN